jgi:two-component system response regulator FixJ
MDKTIYIVDDNTGFRQSTAWWLEGAGYQVESFENPALALEKICEKEDQENTCMLLDVRMPEMSGLDLHEQLNQRGISLPIIYMTGHGDVALAVEAMRKGAVTFLEKPLDDVLLESALEAVYSTPRMQINCQPPAQVQPEPAYMERYETLTPREKQIMEYVVDGKLNKSIAYDLEISLKTVELHRSRVMKKMQVTSAAALVKMALTGQIQ